MVCGGVFTMEQLLPIPLGCADDSAALAAGTTLGVIFSRGPAIALKDVQDLCVEVSNEGRGMVGVSSYLSPNTLLVIGQGDTLSRLEKAIPGRLPERTMLRRKPHKLPPLHTPLVWQRNVPNRAAVALYKIHGNRPVPTPKVISCVTGTANYDGLNARDMLIRWVDHPQLLWDAISETLVAGVNLVIHAGPGLDTSSAFTIKTSETPSMKTELPDQVTSEAEAPAPPRAAAPGSDNFVETALKLGGKSEEEARTTGTLDRADEQVETMFAA